MFVQNARDLLGRRFATILWEFILTFIFLAVVYGTFIG